MKMKRRRFLQSLLAGSVALVTNPTRLLQARTVRTGRTVCTGMEMLVPTRIFTPVLMKEEWVKLDQAVLRAAQAKMWVWKSNGKDLL